jgi:hypothetical protein
VHCRNLAFPNLSREQWSTAPEKFSGLGLHHPEDKQYLLQLQTVITQSRDKKGITYQLLEALFEQHRLEIGIPAIDSNWGLPETKPLFSETWVKKLLVYCQRNNLRIKDSAGDIPKRNLNDKYIIQEFVKKGFRGSHLRKLNECRMFIQAITIGDLVSLDGSKIERWALTGKEKAANRAHFQMAKNASIASPKSVESMGECDLLVLCNGRIRVENKFQHRTMGEGSLFELEMERIPGLKPFV